MSAGVAPPQRDLPVYGGCRSSSAPVRKRAHLGIGGREITHFEEDDDPDGPTRARSLAQRRARGRASSLVYRDPVIARDRGLLQHQQRVDQQQSSRASRASTTASCASCSATQRAEHRQRHRQPSSPTTPDSSPRSATTGVLLPAGRSVGDRTRRPRSRPVPSRGPSGSREPRCKIGRTSKGRGSEELTTRTVAITTT